jgi:hypothetical protein
VAGLIHLVSPSLFIPAIPSFFLFPLEIIWITGLLEIILAAGLLHKRSQDFCAQFIAFYFILLIPIHVYVALNGIEMFGIQHKALLWLRCLLQFPLIFWALALQREGWIIEQNWKHVIFLHYKVSPEILQSKVPFKLDLHEGMAVISVVPFLMDGIRFPFLPPVPWISRLWELNIRTYVEVDGVRGVYFFTLETDSRLAKLIANTFFSLPYRFSKIKSKINNASYLFQHSRDDLSLGLELEVLETNQDSIFDRWATERYFLFTKKGHRIFSGEVMHHPWQLHKIKINDLTNEFTKMVERDCGDLVGSSYAKELKVRFKPFKEIGPKEKTSFGPKKF